MRLIDADALVYKLGVSDEDVYCKEIIEEEPTAQPELCEDAVSRAKINAFCHVIIKRDPSGDNDIVKAFEAFRAYVNSLPSAQPERKKGKWYKPTGMMPPEYAGVYRCSECGEIAMRDWKHHKQVLSNFCPNCGAEMRAERRIDEPDK